MQDPADAEVPTIPGQSSNDASPIELSHALSTAVWLSRLGISRYSSNFSGHSTVADLACAIYPGEIDVSSAEAALRDKYGVVALGPRRKISSALQQWAPAILFKGSPPAKRKLACEGSNKSLVDKDEDFVFSSQRLFRTISGAPPKVPPVPSKKRSRQMRFPTKKKQSQDNNPIKSQPLSTSHTLSQNEEKEKPLWPIFRPGYVPPAKKARTSVLTASKSGQRLFKPITGRGGSSGAPGKKKGGWSDGGGGGRRYHLACHRVPSTNFVVDSFRVPKSSDDATVHFLTHMHSDHYGGLTKSSLPDGAKVFCSETTAALAKTIIGLNDSYFHVLPMETPVKITCPSSQTVGVTVWAYDANHCPGAVVLLMHIWKTNQWVLHCGDCRYNPSVFQKHEQLAHVINARNLHSLYLDTTYAGEAHRFPAQRAVLGELAELVKAENERTKGKALFFVGSYTIGKERVVLEVAQALGRSTMIFAEARKRRIFQTAHLSPEFNRRITDKGSDNLARVFVLPMGKLKADGIREYAQRNKIGTQFIGRGIAVVVRPTGWSYKGSGSGVRKSVRAADGAVVLDVAYSEHSSLVELKQFVQWAQPKHIIPTVGFHQPEKRTQLVQMLRSNENLG